VTPLSGIGVWACLVLGLVGCGSSGAGAGAGVSGTAGQGGGGQATGGSTAAGSSGAAIAGDAGTSGGAGGAAGATAGGSAGTGGSGGAPEPPAGPSVRVLQLNVWQEGTQVAGGLAKIAAVILESEADVAAFSEVRNYDAEDWTTKLIAELKAQAPEVTFYGKFAGGDVGLVSRFPITETHAVFDETDIDAGSIMAWSLEVPGAASLVVASAHLDYQHYALNWVRGYEGGSGAGWDERPNSGALVHETDPEVLLAYNNESWRDEAIADFVAFAETLPQSSQLVLCGDFNEGSDLDWTERAKNEWGHYGAVIPWDNSLLLAASGFRDAYRAVYPHEVDYPGFTWPAPAEGKTTTTWAPRADERDRIDFIYVPETGVTTKDAWVVGPSTTFVGSDKVPNPGQDAFLASDLPWPSDHKGVLVELVLSPAL
jgi:endonuclease/exonuclease/phosphatase family metal-dependent hydrolase